MFKFFGKNKQKPKYCVRPSIHNKENFTVFEWKKSLTQHLSGNGFTACWYYCPIKEVNSIEEAQAFIKEYENQQQTKKEIKDIFLNEKGEIVDEKNKPIYDPNKIQYKTILQETKTNKFFELQKYYKDDTDPQKYKIKLAEVDNESNSILLL